MFNYTTKGHCMNKSAFLALAFMGVVPASFCADDAPQQQAPVTANIANTAEQKRVVKTQVFLNLLHNAQKSVIDAQKFMAFTLEWMQELCQSQDPADQELYHKLYVLVSGIVASMNEGNAEAQ